jgi:hypothetical protein
MSDGGAYESILELARRLSASTMELSTVWCTRQAWSVLWPPGTLLVHARYPPGSLTLVLDGLAAAESCAVSGSVASPDTRLGGDDSATSDSLRIPPVEPYSERNSGIAWAPRHGVIQYTLTL